MIEYLPVGTLLYDNLTKMILLETARRVVRYIVTSKLNKFMLPASHSAATLWMANVQEILFS